MHIEQQLTEIALVGSVALLSGLFLTRLKQPAILGYVLAGVILGPSCLGLVKNRELVAALADLGVLMLLFLIGMELNLRTFRSVWAVTVGCVILQIVGSVTLMWCFSFFFGWSFPLSLLLGCILAVSSTAVTAKMLEDLQETKTEVGKLTIGITIAQDLALIPAILLIRGLTGKGFDYGTGFKIFFSIIFVVALIIYLSRKQRIHLPFTSQIAAQSDLLPLIGLTFCFGTAALAGLIGLSAAYGAFLAGLILGNSAERHKIIETSHPIQSVLLMVFFLSIGLLMDLNYIWQNLGLVTALVLVVTLYKTGLNFLILRLFSFPLSSAFLSSLMLAQIGEFSFMLTSIGNEVKLLDETSNKLVVILTVLSLIFSPLWLAMGRKVKSHSDTIASFKELSEIYGGERAPFLWLFNFFKSLIQKIQPRKN